MAIERVFIEPRKGEDFHAAARRLQTSFNEARNNKGRLSGAQATSVKVDSYAGSNIGAIHYRGRKNKSQASMISNLQRKL